MTKKIQYLNDLIFNKLKKNNSKRINLDKDELNKFINFLINKS